MSLPKDHPPDPLIASVMRAAAGAPASGCPDADVLGLYAERELAGDEHAALDSHVAGCGRCQATVAAFVRSAPEPAAAPSGTGVASSAWWAGWRWMVPLASATAVLAVAVWIGRGPANEVAEQARAGQSASPAERPPEPAPFAPDAQATRGSAVSGPGAGARRAAPEAAPSRQAASSDAGNAATARSDQTRRLADATSPPPAPSADAAFRLARPAVVAEADTARAAEGVTAAAPRDERTRRETLAAAAPPKPSQPSPPPPPQASASPPPLRAPVPASEPVPAPVPVPVPAPVPAPAAGAAAGALDAAGAAPRQANAVEFAKEAPLAALTGTVTYRTRNALPAGAVIEVRLLDVSRADAPATALARSEIVTRGEQVPVPFTLRYAADAVQPRREYRVQATIAIDGRVAWRTTTAYPVFEDGAATTRVDVVVDPVRE